MEATVNSGRSQAAQNLGTLTMLGGTEYKLATNGSHRRLHHFADAEGIPRSEFQFPTVYAEKDGQIIGLLATHIQKGMIIAGPLVVKSDKPRHFTTMRLIEFYDALMIKMGIKAYIFAMPQEDRLIKLVDKMGLKPYATEGGMAFYSRRL